MTDPTPDDVHSYLTAAGWSETDVGPGPWRVYRRGDHHVRVPQWTDALDYRQRLREAMRVVAYVENRMAPEDQVLADVRKRSVLGRRP